MEPSQATQQLAAAYEELRHALADGQIRDAERIGDQISGLLGAEHGDGELSPLALHSEADFTQTA